MKDHTRYRRCGVGLGATVMVAIVAGTVWAGRPNDTKRSSQDDQATRGPSHQAPPPATNRQVERQSPPQSHRSPESASGSSGTRRDNPVRRNEGVPATGRTTRRNNSSSAKNGEVARLVDANREVAETTDINNGARLAPAAILPVDPASFELQPGSARPGEEVLLAGEGLGPQPGRVLIQVNGREMDGVILGWYDLGVRWTVPRLAPNAPVEADVVVVRGDGAAANPVKITLTP